MQEGNKGNQAAENGKQVLVKETPEFKTALSEATSSFQRQASTANKKADDASKSVKDLQGQITGLANELEIARLAGGDDEEATERAKQTLKVQQDARNAISQAAEATDQANQLARSATMVMLSQKHSIEIMELEAFETLDAMRAGAVDLENTRLKAQIAEGVNPRGEETPAEEARKPGEGFEVGKGAQKTQLPDLMGMVTSGPEGLKKFDVHVANMKRQSVIRR
jgi:hypothetical protein